MPNGQQDGAELAKYVKEKVSSYFLLILCLWV